MLVLWVPFFVVLILTLHRVEIQVQISFLCLFMTEVGIHPRIEASLKTDLSLRLIVIEGLIEIGHFLIV